MNTKVYPLSEGHFTVGRDKSFIPFDLEKDELNDRSTGSLLVEVQPFLVVTPQDVILLDTGLGFRTPSGALQISENIRKHGIEPTAVTKILMSHLHKDHAGGLAEILDDSEYDQAKIYVYTSELEFAYEKGAPSYITDELDALRYHSNVVFLDEPQGDVDSFIAYEHTDGHCPEHIVFKIKDENGAVVFYGGDEAPQYKQMRTKYMAKYDYDGRKAMELRAQWAEEGAAAEWTFLFYHDVQTPMAVLPKG